MQRHMLSVFRDHGDHRKIVVTKAMVTLTKTCGHRLNANIYTYCFKTWLRSRSVHSQLTGPTIMQTFILPVSLGTLTHCTVGAARRRDDGFQNRVTANTYASCFLQRLWAGPFTRSKPMQTLRIVSLKLNKLAPRRHKPSTLNLRRGARLVMVTPRGCHKRDSSG